MGLPAQNLILEHRIGVEKIGKNCLKDVAVLKEKSFPTLHLSDSLLRVYSFILIHRRVAGSYTNS